MWHLYAFMHQRNTLQTTTCKFIEIQKAPLHVLDADVYVQIYRIGMIWKIMENEEKLNISTRK